MSSSVTVTMSCTWARMWAMVSSDGDLAAMPSAMVATRSRHTSRPASSEARTAAAPAASTPTTRTSGRVHASAVATPEMRPPPPTATTTTSASGASSASSRPTVP